MNPNTTIRPWILACGAQYGIRQAHYLRWPDADARQYEMYCTYRLVSSEPAQVGHQDRTTASAYNAAWKGVQKWITTVEIDLYNSEDGLYELASFVVGAKHNHNIRDIFNDNCSLIDVISLQELSEFDAHEIIYHQKLVCRFEEDVEFALSETNAIVDDIDVSGAFDIS